MNKKEAIKTLEWFALNNADLYVIHQAIDTLIKCGNSCGGHKMKVKRKRNSNNNLTIESIKAGECFVYDNQLYLKLNMPNDIQTRNAVRLSDGTLFFISLEIIIYPVEAEVTFEYLNFDMEEEK